MKKGNSPLKFEYLNREGKRAARKVKLIKVWYGKTEWHLKKQWFLEAMGIEKGAERNFAFKDITKFAD